MRLFVSDRQELKMINLANYLPLRMDHKGERPVGGYSWCEYPDSCPDCIKDITFMVEIGKIEITEGLMTALPLRIKQKVIEAICLRSLK